MTLGNYSGRYDRDVQQDVENRQQNLVAAHVEPVVGHRVYEL